MKRIPTRELRALVVLGFVFPFLALGHEMLVLVAAAGLRALVTAGALNALVRWVLTSPVYTQIFLETVGGIQPLGMAVAGWPGQVLHGLLPFLFVDPALIAPGAWVSAIVRNDTTLLSLFLAQAAVEAVLIVVGGALIKVCLHGATFSEWFKYARTSHLVCAALGLVLQGQAIWGIFNLTFSVLPDLQDMGIGIAFSLLLQLGPDQYNWLMKQGLPVFIPLALIGIGFGAAWLVEQLADRLTRRGQIFHILYADTPLRVRLANQLVPLALVTACFVFLPPLQRYGGMARMAFAAPVRTPAAIRIAAEPTPSPTAILTLSATPTPTETLAPTRALPSSTPTRTLSPVSTPTAGAGDGTPRPSAATPTDVPTLTPFPIPTVPPSATPVPTLRLPTATSTPFGPFKVDVRRAGKGLGLYVGGQPVVVTGMNYNVNFTLLPEETRRTLHRRDFRILRDAGVNAVIGWGVYDEVTLEVAREFEIGVFMPFELDPRMAYENENERNQVREAWTKFVKRFQKFPAVWGWNPGGDELLHRMDTELHRTPDKLQPAADFLLEMATMAYTLDPDHVSIVKEPRDWYIPYIAEALRKARLMPSGTDPGRYFLFGVNVYGKPDGVAEALQAVRSSADDRMGVGMIVGEFAPFGLARRDRPFHYGLIWDAVQESSPSGGFAYVYGPDQPNPASPNPYDPLRLLVNEFSLVDGDGRPVDESLAALTAKWRAMRSR